MIIKFNEHPNIMNAFSNLLEAVRGSHPLLRGTAIYKLMESQNSCKLLYDVEVSNGACFGVEISEEMLALVLLKYSTASSV